MKSFGVWSAEIPDDWKRKNGDVASDKYQQAIANATVLKQIKEKQGKHLGFYTDFTTKDNEQIIIKTGISFVSIAGAKNNLVKEIAGWNFDNVHQQARNLWAKALDKIRVEGNREEDKYSFYTALYHTMIDPRSFCDVDGKYPGGDGKPHQSATFVKRTIFSGWDVFRSQMPLQTIINPTMVNDMINSWITLAAEKNKPYFDRWEMLNSYSGCMIGNPSISVIADAYAKGIRNYDSKKAYELCVNTANKFGNGSKGFSGGSNSISNTLEYAYTDWCLGQFANGLGYKQDAEFYDKKGLAYQNIFDTSKAWFRPKKENGEWEPWPAEGRLADGYGTVESNPYQQGWFVPQDVAGMVKLMGGKEKVIADLENFFDKVPENMLWNEYYNHANEPVHHVAFLFNYLGTPWLTQKWTRAICKRAYKNSVEGLVGNEDVGQMSAWYVLAASGLHPICPGNTRFEITSPVFDKITFHTDAKYAKGKLFTIEAKDNSPVNIYIQSATLNGQPFKKCYLDFKDILAGGKLELTMGDKPSYIFGQ